MKRLFIDMDGTVAQFYESKRCLEEMGEEGFFKNLKSYKRMVAAIKRFAKKHPEVKLCILSAFPLNHLTAEREKGEWVDEHMPFIPAENRIFLAVGKSKADVVGEITKDDYLLDDYTKNLEDWTSNGGTGIKVRNEINCQNGTWRGNRVSCYDAPEGIFVDLEEIIFG